ncbi:VanZ family protein [Lederbergia citrisecunda]
MRKAAHFFMFGLLAIGDEFHQSLTDGRTQSSQDVLLDMAGACTFLIGYRFIQITFANRKQK